MEDIPRTQLLEGIAAQIYRGESSAGPLTWWHLLSEDERGWWRRKAEYVLQAYEQVQKKKEQT